MMDEDLFTKIQNNIDAAIVKAGETFVLDLSNRKPGAEEAFQNLCRLHQACASGEVESSEVKAAFQAWLEIIKCTTNTEKLLASKVQNVDEMRLCFSIGCTGQVKFSSGVGKCSTCGLEQKLMEAECTLTTSSEEKIEPSKVVSLVTRRRLKGAGKARSTNEVPLFSQ